MDEEIEIEPNLAAMFPQIEMDMVVDDTPIVINNDDKNDVDVPLSSKSLDDYKQEMLENGLVDSDMEYFTRAYKNLEEVKFIKIHCTGCDKHMGSAPNEMENRFQHPILKVLLCAKCFQFYCSGEFEKGEDGSELYCRWCGEGGLVYCCTKCPFVFCKNCITRNLGRGTARIIENTEYWICFSCNPWQISRHRATYWAIQKFSEEMIAHSKITGDITQLEVDANICCQGKKRSEPCEKSRTSVAKRSKIVKVPFESGLLESVLLNNTPSTSKGKKSLNLSSLWRSIPIASLEPEDEVICTPDIIPIDESPPGSPLLTTPPPLIPYVIQQQSVSKILPQPPPLVGKGKLVPVNIKNLQKNVQKHVFTPIGKLPTNRLSPINFGILNQPEGLRIVHHPSTSSSHSVKQTPQTNDSGKSTETPEGENDWFDKAILECAEVTEYVSTKISGLSGVHSRAHKSERLMEELHNTLQTYIHVAIDKMRKIKRNMHVNFVKERSKSEKIVNPFAKTKPRTNEDSSSQETQSASEDDSYVPKEEDYSTQDTDSTITSVKRKRKNKIVPRREPITKTTEIQRGPIDDDVIFDMDVTNASDEEMESRTASSIGSEAHFQTEEVINIISSDDDSDIEEVIITNKASSKEDQNAIEVDKEEVENKANTEAVENKTNKEEVETRIDEINKEEKADKTKEEEGANKNEERENKNEEKANKAEENSNKNEEEKTVKPIQKEEIQVHQTKETDKTITEEGIQAQLEKETDKTLVKETPNINEAIKNPDAAVVVEELVRKVEMKFNIQNIPSKDLLNYLSAKVILYNNRRAQKEFAKVAITETKLKQFDVVETIENLLNTKWELTNEKVDKNEENGKTHNDVEMEEPCDVEEMLGSGVVLRAKKSFGDEFSRFIGKSSESDCRNVQSSDEDDFSEKEDISNNEDEPDNLEQNIVEANNLEKNKVEAKDLEQTNVEAINLKQTNVEPNKLEEANVEPNKLEQTNVEPNNLEQTKVESNNLEQTNVESKNLEQNVETKNFEHTMETNNDDADKNDKMSDDSDLDEAELFFNKDNESLSLPPDGIGDSITTNNIFATKETENSDLVLDSGILALKQMAENCVNPTVELRQASTECNG